MQPEAFRRVAVTVAFGMALLGVEASARAQSVNPNNGHSYGIVGSDLTWQEAKELVTSGQCHLATITSQQEQDWIEDNVLGEDSCWIGGMQPTTAATPDDMWQWVTGEAFVYDNWDIGEPNDFDTEDDETDHQEQCLEIFDDGPWNDESCDSGRCALFECEPAAAPAMSASVLVLLISLLCAIGTAMLARKRQLGR